MSRDPKTIKRGQPGNSGQFADDASRRGEPALDNTPEIETSNARLARILSEDANEYRRRGDHDAASVMDAAGPIIERNTEGATTGKEYAKRLRDAAKDVAHGYRIESREAVDGIEGILESAATRAEKF